MVEMRRRLHHFFKEEFYNPDGLELSVAEWLYILLDLTPRSHGTLRSTAIATNLRKYDIPPNVRKLILRYDRLRTQVIVANHPLCVTAVKMCKFKDAIGHEDAVSIALGEFQTVVDRYDDKKGALSTIALQWMQLSLRRYATRHLSEFSGTRAAQDTYNAAKRLHQLLSEHHPTVTLDDVGAEICWAKGMTTEDCRIEWQEVKRASRPPNALSLNEQVVGA